MLLSFCSYFVRFLFIYIFLFVIVLHIFLLAFIFIWFLARSWRRKCMCVEVLLSLALCEIRTLSLLLWRTCRFSTCLVWWKLTIYDSICHRSSWTLRWGRYVHKRGTNIVIFKHWIVRYLWNKKLRRGLSHRPPGFVTTPRISGTATVCTVLTRTPSQSVCPLNRWAAIMNSL